MEGAVSSMYVIKVDTVNARVTLATTSYSGAVASVGLFTSSNVVLGDGDLIVLYTTGTLLAVDARFSQTILVNGAIVPSTTTVAPGLTTAHSTATVNVPSGSTAATAFSVCYATASVTVSADNANVAVWYSGSVHNSNAGAGCITSFLQDGAFLGGYYTKDRGHGVGVSHSGNLPAQASFFTIVPGVSSGVHDFCLTLAALSNTCNITAASYTISEFGVMELK